MLGYGSSPNGVELRIDRIETVLLRVPLPRVYAGSCYRMTHRSTIVTRVYTGGGVVGEAYVGDEDAGLIQIDRIIHKEIAPLVVGQDAMATERIWHLTRSVPRDILRDRRLALVASACMDAALWDAVGKYLGVPLYRLWGGFREDLPVISIGGYYGDDRPLATEVSDLLSSGYAGMKLKVGGLSPIEDAERVKEVRRDAGSLFKIAVEANQAWAPAEAIQFSRLIADFDILWFEEPCQWHNDRRAMRDVRASVGIPVCAGQSEFSAAGCRDLFETGSVDFCNFDASWPGGPTEWRRVAAMATAYDVRMAHHEEPQIAAHLLASIPHGTYLEHFHSDRDPIWHNLVANRPTPRDGSVALPSAPGLGWERDEDFITKYRVSGSEEAA